MSIKPVNPVQPASRVYRVHNRDLDFPHIHPNVIPPGAHRTLQVGDFLREIDCKWQDHIHPISNQHEPVLTWKIGNNLVGVWKRYLDECPPHDPRRGDTYFVIEDSGNCPHPTENRNLRYGDTITVHSRAVLGAVYLLKGGKVCGIYLSRLAWVPPDTVSDPTPSQCVCDITTLLRTGCVCGQIAREKASAQG